MSDWLHYLSDENFDCGEAKEKLRRNQNLPRRPLTEPGSPDKRAENKKRSIFLYQIKNANAASL